METSRNGDKQKQAQTQTANFISVIPKPNSFLALALLDNVSMKINLVVVMLNTHSIT